MDNIINIIDKMCEYKETFIYKKRVSYVVHTNRQTTLQLLKEYLDPFMEKGEPIGLINNIFALNSDELYNMVNILARSASCVMEETGNYTLKYSEQLSVHLTQNTGINLGFIQDIYCNIRENNMLCENVSILFHGAAVYYNNKGILILGNKGSGKSYLSDYAILKKRAYLIAADQTIVVPQNNKFIMRGNITSYRINILENQYLSDEQRERLLEYSSDIFYDSRRITSQNKFNLSPLELERFLQVKMKQDVLLNTIIILRDIRNENIGEFIKRYAIKGNYNMDTINNLVKNINIYFANEKRGITFFKNLLEEK